MHMKKAILSLLAAAFFFTLPVAYSAGKLDDFEKAATERAHSTSEKSEHEDDDEEDSFLGDLIGDMLSALFVDAVPGMCTSLISGAKASLARAHGSEDPKLKDVKLRTNGSPELPFVRADFCYQRIDPSTRGIDGRIESGYGPFGLQSRMTHLTEENPDDELDLTYVHGLYRLSDGSGIEFDIGLGALFLEGDNQNSGFSMTYPFNYYPHPHWGIRLVPAWSWIKGNGINDYDVSLAYIQDYYSFRLGFRRIQSHDEALQGPYAGFSLYF